MILEPTERIELSTFSLRMRYSAKLSYIGNGTEWTRAGSNRRPSAFQTDALPTEPPIQVIRQYESCLKDRTGNTVCTERLELPTSGFVDRRSTPTELRALDTGWQTRIRTLNSWSRTTRVANYTIRHWLLRFLLRRGGHPRVTRTSTTRYLTSHPVRCGVTTKPANRLVVIFSAPGGIRTPNLTGRNRLLYPVELRGQKLCPLYRTF